MSDVVDYTATSRDPYTDFASFGDVKRPDEADAPILGPATRQVLQAWLFELNYAEDLAKVGVKPRRRAILSGPPGTGKTTLAWHVAARLGLPLVVVETPSIVSSYLGGTGQKIGDLFARARRHKNRIALFFDEIDAIAHKRGGDSSAAGTELNNIVNALLQMLDRHEGLVFAATNRPDAIDPAIWRRFQLQIDVPLPAPQERFAIVKRYVAPFAAEDAAVATISAALAGAAPALIREVVESVKRDLVLGHRLRHDLSPAAVFGRIRAGSAPSSGMPTPPLWCADKGDEALERLAAMPWPPTLAGAA